MYQFFSSLLPLFLLSSCAATPNFLQHNAHQCYVNGVIQPDWLCSDGKVIEGSFTAVGTSKMSNIGVEYIKSEALEAGQHKLTKKLEMLLTLQIREFEERADIKSDEAVSMLSADVTEQLSKIVQLRSKLLKYREVNGELYALVGVSQNRLNKTIKQVIKNSLKKKKELWLKFQMNNAQKILDEIFYTE